MPISYLEELERQILTGTVVYACPGRNANEWVFSKEKESLLPNAQRTANQRKFEVVVYRLINKKDAAGGDSFLVVRKYIGRRADGTFDFEWSIVDSLESAEMLRDVSQGPTPLFGAVVEVKLQPS